MRTASTVARDGRASKRDEHDLESSPTRQKYCRAGRERGGSDLGDLLRSTERPAPRHLLVEHHIDLLNVVEPPELLREEPAQASRAPRQHSPPSTMGAAPGVH